MKILKFTVLDIISENIEICTVLVNTLLVKILKFKVLDIISENIEI